VYGDAALRVAPHVAAIADGMRRLLTDDALHAALVAAGQRRLPHFSWDRSAEIILRELEIAAR
jgi:hypothetical protein